MITSKKIVQLFCPPLLFLAFISTTNPTKLPLPILLFPFLLIGLSLYLFIRELLVLTPISQRKIKLTALTLTIIILIGVLLQSIRQLSIKDFLILATLVVCVALYLRKVEV